MNSELFTAAQPGPIRWTLRDLFMTALLTIVLVAALLLAILLPAALGVDLIRDLLDSRRLVAGMIVGGLVYVLAVVATYAIIVRRHRGSWREIGFRAPPLVPLLLTPAIFFGQLILLAIANLIVQSIIGTFENPQVEQLTDSAGFSWLNFVAVFTVGAIIAPVVEEMLFRGLLYQWLRNHIGAVGAILLSGAIFSAVHFISVLLLPLFVIGVLLAAVFEWTRSLWITITLHFFQNAMAIGLLFFLQANPNLLPQT
ncbi:MAG: CPBP family intramembrane metalloprotease [Chloroflexi bacterium]|nr:CPBP family intramembrane metalloprotease [Chloroflexota bacterium]